MTVLRRVLMVAGVATLVGGTAVGVRLNPAVVPASAAAPTELLQDGSFEQPATIGAWNVAAGASPGAYRVLDDPTARQDRRIGRLTLAGVSQEVLLTPVRGRAYRFSIQVRSNGSAGGNGGLVRAQTACAAAEEVAETTFVASSSWTEVSATVQPIHGERCTMRVTVAINKGSVDLDGARFADAGLVNPSFELGDGAESWTVDSGVVARPGTDGSSEDGAVDGGRFLEVRAATAGRGIRQDAPIDASSEPVLAVASVLVRALDGPVDVALTYREPCGATVYRVTATAGSAWQRVTVRQPRLAGDAIPPGLIRVDGRPCVAQVAIVALAQGAFDVDAASLELSSYWPPEGDPSYRRLVKRRDAISGAKDGTVVPGTPAS